MQDGYVSLAASVARAAVEDLYAVYKKVRLWDSLERGGVLSAYVEKQLEKKGNSKYGKISITQDELSAINFFNPDSEEGQMYLSLLDIDVIPWAMTEQVEFIKQNVKPLQEKIRQYRAQVTRKTRDEAI